MKLSTLQSYFEACYQERFETSSRPIHSWKVSLESLNYDLSFNVIYIELQIFKIFQFDIKKHLQNACLREI